MEHESNTKREGVPKEYVFPTSHSSDQTECIEKTENDHWSRIGNLYSMPGAIH